MSAHIGTNFSLQSSEFLDSRQGQALSKADLLNWKTPVPEGFEICLENEWYYYDSRVNFTTTGHWVPRVYKGEGTYLEGQSVSANYLTSLQNKIDDLEQIVRSLSINFNLIHIKYDFGDDILKPIDIDIDNIKFVINNLIGIIIRKQGEIDEDHFRFADLDKDGKLDIEKDIEQFFKIFERIDYIYRNPNYFENAIANQGVYEVGSQVFPYFRLDLEQDGKVIENSKIDKFKIDSVGGVDFYTKKQDFGTSTRFTVYANGLLSSTASTRSIRIPVRAFLQTGHVIYGEVSYKFLSNIYWGMSSKNELISGLPSGDIYETDYLKFKNLGFNSKLSENYNIDSELTCVLGKTPVVILPNNYLYSKMRPIIYINDGPMFDLWKIEFNVRNSKGLDLSYTAYGIENFTFDNPIVKLKVVTVKDNE